MQQVYHCPIERERVAGLPVPRVSMGIIAQSPERAENYSRRFPYELSHLLSEKERTVIRTSSGAAKGVRLPLRVVDTPRVVWFARLRSGGRDGRPTRLRQILGQVHAIGKKVSQGFGRVARWDVSPCDDDWSWFAPHEGGPVLMRPLPVDAVPEDVVGGRRTYCGVCSPYWQQTLWTEAFEPC